MPKSTTYAALIRDCDALVKGLLNDAKRVSTEIPKDVMSGGRLTAAMIRTKDQSSSSIKSGSGVAGLMRSECQARYNACVRYESALAAYESAMSHYRSAAASHAAATNAYAQASSKTKPGGTVGVTPPGPAPIAPTAPVPPPFWSK